MNDQYLVSDLVERGRNRLAELGRGSNGARLSASV